MKIATIGIDLAKTVLQVHGVDGRSKTVLRKQLKRKDVVSFFANLEPCLIGMEARGDAHYWARNLAELGTGGHSVGLRGCWSVSAALPKAAGKGGNLLWTDSSNATLWNIPLVIRLIAA